MTAVTSALRLCGIASIFLMCGGQNAPNSPCPKVFTYENDGEQWYGHIMIPSPPYDSEMKLTVSMSIQASLPTKYSGTIELIGDRGKILEDILKGYSINYKVNFPLLHPLPKVTKITFNERVVCTGPSETLFNGARDVTDISLDHTLQTGASAERPNFNQNTYEPTYKYEDYPNPDRFARPQTTRPKPQTPRYETEESNADAFNKFLNQWADKNDDQLSQQQQQQPQQRPQQQPQPRLQQRLQQRLQPEVQTEESVQTEEPAQSWIEPETPAPPRTQPRPQQMPQQRPQKLDETPSPEFTSKDPECGYPNANTLFVLGDDTKKGDWPWLVAMYIKKPSSLDFHCAGTLVSHKHVVTAAHCIKDKSNPPYTVNEVIIKVGVFNLQEWTDSDVKQLGVSKIQTHPKYSGALSLLNDIAILVLVMPVEYSNVIKPACLWDIEPDLSVVVGKNGTVVGWGRDENGLVATPEPRVGKVPIVSTQTCRASLARFSQLTSDFTLCAGARDGTGPCNGDSGGGMYILNRGKWYLRAIVSLSLPGDEMPCNLDEYVVYTDTAQYLPWIKKIMAENP